MIPVSQTDAGVARGIQALIERARYVKREHWLGGDTGKLEP
jgi:hypothetical protein